MFRAEYTEISNDNDWRIAIQKYANLLGKSNKVDDLVSANVTKVEREAIQTVF